LQKRGEREEKPRRRLARKKIGSLEGKSHRSWRGMLKRGGGEKGCGGEKTVFRGKRQKRGREKKTHKKNGSKDGCD